jgi:antirestriction protein
MSRNKKESLAESILETVQEYLSEEVAVNEVYEDGEIIDYVKENMAPSDVFDFEILKDWAQSQDVAKIMDESDLQVWAEENGYTKETSKE